jgi:hypothetical protein
MDKSQTSADDECYNAGKLLNLLFQKQERMNNLNSKKNFIAPDQEHTIVCLKKEPQDLTTSKYEDKETLIKQLNETINMLLFEKERLSIEKDKEIILLISKLKEKDEQITLFDRQKQFIQLQVDDLRKRVDYFEQGMDELKAFSVFKSNETCTTPMNLSTVSTMPDLSLYSISPSGFMLESLDDMSISYSSGLEFDSFINNTSSSPSQLTNYYVWTQGNRYSLDKCSNSQVFWSGMFSMHIERDSELVHMIENKKIWFIISSHIDRSKEEILNRVSLIKQVEQNKDVMNKLNHLCQLFSRTRDFSTNTKSILYECMNILFPNFRENILFYFEQICFIAMHFIWKNAIGNGIGMESLLELYFHNFALSICEHNYRYISNDKLEDLLRNKFEKMQKNCVAGYPLPEVVILPCLWERYAIWASDTFNKYNCQIQIQEDEFSFLDEFQPSPNKKMKC